MGIKLVERSEEKLSKQSVYTWITIDLLLSECVRCRWAVWVGACMHALIVILYTCV